MSNIIKKIQQVIQDYNSTLNVLVGSALYYMVVVPAGKVYEYITSLIDDISSNTALSTSSNKELLLENFNISKFVGTPGEGELYIKVSTSSVIYTFPVGTIFTHSSGATIETTEEKSTSLETTIAVKTATNTSTSYEVGEVFTTSLYGTLITECYVSKEITGGASSETDEALLDRVKLELSQCSVTKPGIIYKLKNNFPNIIDIAIYPNTTPYDRSLLPRHSGIKIDTYVKTPLEQATATSAVIKDTIYKIVGTRVTKNRGTKYEENTLSSYTNGLTYTRFSLLNDLQDFADDTDTFPLGVDLLIIHATPVTVSGTIYTRTNQTSKLDALKQYILSHTIKPFKISDMVTTVGIVDYMLPIELSFKNEYTGAITSVIDIYNYDNSAYYYGNISIQTISS